MTQNGAQPDIRSPRLEGLEWVERRRWTAANEFHRLNGENRPKPVVGVGTPSGCFADFSDFSERHSITTLLRRKRLKSG